MEFFFLSPHSLSLASNMPADVRVRVFFGQKFLTEGGNRYGTTRPFFLKSEQSKGGRYLCRSDESLSNPGEIAHLIQFIWSAQFVCEKGGGWLEEGCGGRDKMKALMKRRPFSGSLWRRWRQRSSHDVESMKMICQRVCGDLNLKRSNIGAEVALHSGPPLLPPTLQPPPPSLLSHGYNYNYD